MTIRRALLLLVLASIMLAGMPQIASANGLGLRRWYGAEYGFDEISCPSLGSNCPAFSAAFGGIEDDDEELIVDVASRPTGLKFLDPDGVEREWWARTGNRLFLAAVPGEGPAYAFLGTSGSVQGAVPAGTISFAFQIHTSPSQPVVIFRHDSLVAQKTLTLSLLPDRRLALATSGFVALTQEPLTTGSRAWHEVTLSYAPGLGAPVKLYVDDSTPLEGTLPFGGPDGHVSFGIVSPTASRFAIGFDDYVESSQPNADIHGARIDYLMPGGDGGSSQWSKVHHDSGCRDAGKNWQFVAEDQTVQVKNPKPGESGTCNVGNGSVATTTPGVVDIYKTEGIPSTHVASSTYRRDLTIRPTFDDTILGVRMSVRGRTDLEGLKIRVGYTDAGYFVPDELTFDYGPAAGAMAMWGRTDVERPNDLGWNPAALSGVRLHLDSGPTSGVSRSISAVNIDYVWVPDR